MTHPQVPRRTPPGRSRPDHHAPGADEARQLAVEGPHTAAPRRRTTSAHAATDALPTWFAPSVQNSGHTGRANGGRRSQPPAEVVEGRHPEGGHQVGLASPTGASRVEGSRQRGLRRMLGGPTEVGQIRAGAQPGGDVGDAGRAGVGDGQADGDVEPEQHRTPEAGEHAASRSSTAPKRSTVTRVERSITATQRLAGCTLQSAWAITSGSAVTPSSYAAAGSAHGDRLAMPAVTCHHCHAQIGKIQTTYSVEQPWSATMIPVRGGNDATDPTQRRDRVRDTGGHGNCAGAARPRRRTHPRHARRLHAGLGAGLASWRACGCSTRRPSRSRPESCSLTTAPAPTATALPGRGGGGRRS